MTTTVQTDANPRTDDHHHLDISDFPVFVSRLVRDSVANRAFNFPSLPSGPCPLPSPTWLATRLVLVQPLRLLGGPFVRMGRPAKPTPGQPLPDNVPIDDPIPSTSSPRSPSRNQSPYPWTRPPGRRSVHMSSTILATITLPFFLTNTRESQPFARMAKIAATCQRRGQPSSSCHQHLEVHRVG